MRSWAHNTSLRRVAERLAHGARREYVARCLALGRGMRSD